jgi:DNA-directed RNA polymerase specialized sigma24 family protein
MDSNRQPSALRNSVASATHTHGESGESGAAATVTALFAVNGLGLAKLAYVMIGDREAADDIVQDAFSGLYRRWEHLSDPGKALAYVRSAVLNSCRSALRRR